MLNGLIGCDAGRYASFDAAHLRLHDSYIVEHQPRDVTLFFLEAAHLAVCAATIVVGLLPVVTGKAVLYEDVLQRTVDSVVAKGEVDVGYHVDSTIVIGQRSLHVQVSHAEHGIAPLQHVDYMEAIFLKTRIGVYLHATVHPCRGVSSYGAGEVVGNLHWITIVVAHADVVVGILFLEQFQGHEPTGAPAAPQSCVLLEQRAVAGQGIEHEDGRGGIGHCLLLIVHAINL